MLIFIAFKITGRVVQWSESASDWSDEEEANAPACEIPVSEPAEPAKLRSGAQHWEDVLVHVSQGLDTKLSGSGAV